MPAPGETPIKRFVGHMAAYEGTGTNYHGAVYKMYCNTEECPMDKLSKDCRYCEHVTSERV